MLLHLKIFGIIHQQSQLGLFVLGEGVKGEEETFLIINSIFKINMEHLNFLFLLQSILITYGFQEFVNFI